MAPGLSTAKAVAAPLGVYRLLGLPGCHVTVSREREIVYACAYVDGAFCEWFCGALLEHKFAAK